MVFSRVSVLDGGGAAEQEETNTVVEVVEEGLQCVFNLALCGACSVRLALMELTTVCRTLSSM